MFKSVYATENPDPVGGETLPDHDFLLLGDAAYLTPGDLARERYVCGQHLKDAVDEVLSAGLSLRRLTIAPGFFTAMVKRT